MKLHNVIFPIWLLVFISPLIFLALIGNFVIDSLVIICCFYFFKVENNGIELKSFYFKSILLVWLFGFLADFIGATVLFSFTVLEEQFSLPNEIVSAIFYNPFNHPVAVLVIVITMVMSGFFIYFFNYKITFKNHIKDKHLRFKIALTIAIITTPWTFLLPTEWFYY